MMGLLDAVQNAGREPRGEAPPGGWKIAAAVQGERDQAAQTVRTRELQFPNGGGGQIPTSAVVNAAPGGFSADAVIGALQQPDGKSTTAAAPKAETPKRVDFEPLIKAKVEDARAAVGETAAHLLTGIGSTIIGGWRGLSEIARGGSLADAANAVREETEKRTYQPESAGGKAGAEALASDYNPLNWPGMLAKKAGEKAQDLGASPGVATAIETGLNAAPLLFARGGKGAAKPAAVPELAARAGGEAVNLDIPTYLRKQQGAGTLADVGKPVPESPPAAPLQPVARLAPDQAAGAAETPRGARTAPGERVSTVPPEPIDAGVKLPDLAKVADEEPVAGGLPKTAHPERQSLLQRIGLQNARNSAIEGDAQKGAVDFQLAKFTEEPIGKAAADQFAAEKSALQGHAAKIVKETGGTPGMDEGALIARGSNIVAPLDALKDYFRKATRALYSEADAKSGGIAGVTPEGFGKIINTDSAFAGKAPNQALGNGIRSYLREQGIMDKDGALRPITVKEAEGVKQYINSQYSHETSGLAGNVKNALDKDVYKSAGEDVYQKGRAMYAQWMRTLGDPKGVSKLMDYDPQNPMNRAVAFEKIPDTVSRMSGAQYDHLLDTLRNVPPELKPQAQAAIKEIQAHWAEKLMQKGTGKTPDAMWNAPRVTEEIKLNSAKIANAFKDSPKLAADIADLQKAGNVLRVPMSYPGAAAQAANSVKRGAMSNILRPIGASAGGAVGSVFGLPGAAAGAFVGEMAGSRAATALSERAALKKWNKGLTMLKDMP